jgi:hypothetical protein
MISNVFRALALRMTTNTIKPINNTAVAPYDDNTAKAYFPKSGNMNYPFVRANKAAARR